MQILIYDLSMSSLSIYSPCISLYFSLNNPHIELLFTKSIICQSMSSLACLSTIELTSVDPQQNKRQAKQTQQGLLRCLGVKLMKRKLERQYLLVLLLMTRGNIPYLLNIQFDWRYYVTVFLLYLHVFHLHCEPRSVVFVRFRPDKLKMSSVAAP